MLIRIACIVLLVFTTIAPSIATANTGISNSNSITIHAGSEQRTIHDAYGYVLLGTSKIYPMYERDIGDGKVQLYYSEQQLDPQQIYKVIYTVRYTEDGQSYHFVEERMLSGSTISGGTEFTIPSTDQLFKSRITSDNYSLEKLEGEIHFGDNKEWSRTAYYFNDSDVVFASTDQLAAHLSLNGEMEDKKYSFKTALTIGQDLSFESLLANASEVTLANKAELVNISNLEDINFISISNVEDEPIMISNGHYRFFIENNNGLDWRGRIEISGNQTIPLPTELTDISFSHFHQQVDPDANNLHINYSLKLLSEPFQAELTGDSDIKFSLSGEGFNEEWVEHSTGGSESFSTKEMKNGTYTLEATFEFNGKSYTAKEEFQLNAGVQPLKGTVITAESASGKSLNSGEVTLYRVNQNYGYMGLEHVKTEQIKEVDGNYEAFIPDAYILDGSEYILIIQDDNEKAVYVRKLIGQAEKELHFKADTLKEIKLETGQLKTVDVHATLVDPQNNYFQLPVDLDGLDWKISSDYPVAVSWSGSDAEKVGYSWSGLLDITNDEVGDLTNATWKTIKPSSIYKNATIGFNGGAENQFKQLNVSHSVPFANQKLYMEVTDGDTKYTAHIYLSQLQEDQEVSFNEFRGSVGYDPNQSLVFTWYEGYNGSELKAYSETTKHSYKYELYNENGELVGEPITSTDITRFTIPTDVPNGLYTVKLDSTTLNSDIVSISLEAPLLIGEGVNGNAEKLTLPINFETAYGLVEPRWYSYIEIFTEERNSEYYYGIGLDWNYDLNNGFESHYPVEIIKDRQYTVKLKLFIPSTNTYIMDEIQMTGEQLLNVNEQNPLQVSDNLNLVTLDSSGLGREMFEKQLYLQKTSDKETSRYTHMYLGSDTTGNSTNAANVNLLLPKESYFGTFVAKDSKRNVNLIRVPEFNSSTNPEIFLDTKNLANITIENNGAALPILGYQILPTDIAREGINYYVPSISYSKGFYDHLTFYVATENKLDTPWGYELIVSPVNLDGDKTFEFSGKIEGEITNAKIIQLKNGHHVIELNHSLTSGAFQVDRIYHAVERNQSVMKGFSAEKDPIREYHGLFDQMNGVPVVYSLKDGQGNVIWEETNQYSSYRKGDFYLDQTLEQGVYTLHVHIPTAPRKSLTMTKEIIVTGEATPFIQIVSPKVGSLTNEQTIQVIGMANEGAAVTLQLQKEDKTIETLTVNVDDNGQFVHAFELTDEGNYAVVASHDKESAAVDFVIDRTAPEKATTIKFEQETSGLTVSWKGATDAISYTVEVAEGSEPYKILAEKQTGTTAVLSNIKPGVTYNVKVTSYDKAGNYSVSDTVIYEVPAFMATSISIEDKRNANKLLAIGDELKVIMEGTYAEGYVASATLTADGVDKDIELAFNDEKNVYEGIYVIQQDTKQIEKITGSIVDGSVKTEPISKAIAWSVGSTVKGSVNDGEPVKNATVRLVAANKTITATTDAAGEYVFSGIPANTYRVTVSVEGKTFAQETIEVGQAVVKTIEQIKLPATTTATFTLVDAGTQKPVLDNLSVRLIGPKGFAAYGTTANGKFKTYDGKDELPKLETGDYTLTVYGQGAYNTTHETVSLVKGTKDYQIEVDKIDVVEKDITISFNGEIDKIDSISLYSHSTYAKYQYSGVGSHYVHNVTLQNGNIVIKNVAIADDYELNVFVEGYMSTHKIVDLSANQTIEVDMEKGRTITGKVTDSQGAAIQQVDVYAYSGNTNYTTRTNADGRYELIGLSKTDDIYLSVNSSIYLQHNESIPKGEQEAQVDIQLAKAASMTGKVVDRSGKALDNVSISASGENSYGWARTAPDGSFTVTGLEDTKAYSLTFSSYGYPTVTVNESKVGNIGIITLQAEGDGHFDGEGNFFAASKSSVVPGDDVQFTLSYQNNGTAEASNVPVTLTLPKGLTVIPATATLNGKPVDITGNKVNIPKVAAKEAGKITFSATVSKDVVVPSLTTFAKVTDNGTVLAATTSVVFVTLEAPAQTGSTSVKVYGNAKYGSTVEVFANNKLVGKTKVDSKWWYADVQLPVSDATKSEAFTVTAKVTDGTDTVVSKPIQVTYKPDIPQVKDVTVYAGWNGDVSLNPYTGIATFAISENTPLDTTVVFDKAVDSAKITFLGKSYNLAKGKDHTFTFDGSKLGRWTSYGEQLLELTYKKGDVEVTMPLMNIIVLIDPSGFVFEGSMDAPLQGVQAVVETEDKDREWVRWDAAKFGQINPQVTDEEGRYGWDVIAGKWRVIFTKDGYEPYISRVMNVPPPETELNVPMVRNTDPVIRTTEVSGKDLTVKFDRLMNVADKATFIQLVEVGSNQSVAGTVQTVDVSGYQSLTEVPADKLAGFVKKDSREEVGFFEQDPSKSVSKTFTFVPAEPLKADTAYKLVVSGQLADYAGKILGENREFTFTTEKDASNEGEKEPGTEPEPEPNPGKGTGNAGSGGGGKGGSGATPPTQNSSDGKEVVNPATGDKTLIVDEKTIADKIADSKQTEIIIPLAAKADEKVNSLSATLSNALTKQIIDSKKPLVVTANGASVSLPTETLKALFAKGGDNIKISVGVADPKQESLPVLMDKSTILSSLYDFNVSIEKGGKEEKVSTFVKPITIKATIEKVKDARKVAAYYLNDKTNKWEYVGGKVQDQQFAFKVSHFSKYAVIENDKSFTDIHTGGSAWAKEYIESLASKTIINGKTSETFVPNDQITRSQFAQLLARALNLPKKPYEGTFSDVTEKMDWMVYDIEAANRAGIVTGDNGKFKPNEKITRQQMAAMIIRAIEYQDATLLEGVESVVPFKDAASISDYAQQYVGLAVSLGIISGREVDGEYVFAPKENATRAHAAKMLYYLLELF